MKILAIETSCDDTGISILEVSAKEKFKVLSNIVSSQIEIHKPYGGVFPMMAKREHQKNLVPVLIKVLKEAQLLISQSKTLNPKQIKNLKKILERESELLSQLIPFFEKYDKPDINYIAIVNGPGLEPCLWAGVNLAKALSYVWDIPLIPVNHIESHMLVNFLDHAPNKKLFPTLSLVVSGGHTQLIFVEEIGKYKIIGETRDDAAGECFDKAAKILGLGYPGGPIISKIDDETKQNYRLIRENKRIILPRPMMNTKDFDFSFSGLKTAVLYKVRDQKKLDKKFIREMCFEVQSAIIEVLLKKTFTAVKKYKAKTIILGGGVSANTELRKQFKLQASKLKLTVLIPPTHLSTDNALMSAVTGYFHRNKKVSWKNLKANGNLRVGK